MQHEPPRARRRHRGHAAAATAGALAAVLIAGLVGLARLEGAAAAPVTAPGPVATSRALPPSAPAPAGEAPALTLPRSAPTSLSVPALDVQAEVMELGLHADGTMEVPPHAPRATSRAGWYRHSPTPGELGPSIVVGHVDSDRHGPSVFFGLGTLEAGDTIAVGRADGTTATFTVDRVAQYGKDDFPGDEVYGNLDHAGLRLITCGGEFDRDRMQYEDNIVVYASLTATSPAAA